MPCKSEASQPAQQRQLDARLPKLPPTRPSSLCPHLDKEAFLVLPFELKRPRAGLHSSRLLPFHSHTLQLHPRS